MRILLQIAATLLLLIQLPSISKAWAIRSQFIRVSPTIPIHISSLSLRRTAIGERIHNKLLSKLDAIKNNQPPFSEESGSNVAGAGTGTDTDATEGTDAAISVVVKVPGLSSLRNRTNDVDHDENGGTVNSPCATQPRKITNFTKQVNSYGSSSDVRNNNIQSNDDDELSSKLLATTIVAVLAAVAAAVGISSSQGGDFSISTLLLTGSNFVVMAREVLQDPGTALDNVVELTNSMGELGIIYFGIAYCIAEILAIPAIPLTASAGYLFGPVKGTAIVLLSASIAAGISFTIGRTLLRDYVENILKDYPKFAKLDRAIGREGFKLMLLLRLSPIFPFALSNYLYGASSINFTAFFGGTLLGFAPGTIAYVYTGYVGKALTMAAEDGAGSDVYPWYVYIGGLSLFAGLLKVVADTATRVVEEIEAEEEEEAATTQSNDVFH